jgi:hypothetical protein
MGAGGKPEPWIQRGGLRMDHGVACRLQALADERRGRGSNGFDILHGLLRLQLGRGKEAEQHGRDSCAVNFPLADRHAEQKSNWRATKAVANMAVNMDDPPAALRRGRPMAAGRLPSAAGL